MTQNVASRLLVVGNGFDLKSKFENYYNSKVDMVKLLDKINAKFNDLNSEH